MSQGLEGLDRGHDTDTIVRSVAVLRRFFHGEAVEYRGVESREGQEQVHRHASEDAVLDQRLFQTVRSPKMEEVWALECFSHVAATVFHQGREPVVRDSPGA